MISFIKTLSVVAILGSIFFINTAFASEQTNWQRIPENRLEYYWIINIGTYEYLDNYTATSTDNFRYWDIPSPYVSRLESTTTAQSIITYNWHFWIFADTNFPNDIKVARRYLPDNYFEEVFASTTAEFMAGSDYIRALRFNSFGATTTSDQISFSTQGHPAHIYLILYTDQDLSYIDTKEKFYDYLRSAFIYYVQLPSAEEYQALITLPAGTCDDLGTIAGALCRVITYLFFPSQASLNQFSQLKDLIANKPPFGYYTSIKNSLNTLSSTTTPAFALTTEINNIAIFGTLKIGLIWILWFFFGFWVIKRISRFDF